MPKPGETREDGKTYWCGRWQTKEDIISARKQAPEDQIAKIEQEQRDRRFKEKEKNRKSRNRRKYEKKVNTPELREKWRRQNRRKYAQNKERYNSRRVELARKKRDHENRIHREWYYKNWERARHAEIERRRNRNPTHGLFDAISQFRSGSIGIDELNRRYDEAIKRTDEIFSGTREDK